MWLKRLTIRTNSLFLLLLLLSQACSTVPRETPETIAGREVILMEAPVTLGRISSPGDSVMWTGTGKMLLTPTTLYFTQWLAHTSYSYAMMTSVRVENVRLPDFPGIPDYLPDQLVIEISRPSCGASCVFRLASPEAARKAASLIELQRPKVDPFGRLHQPRQVWLSAGARSATAWWSMTPEYLQRRAPGKKKAIEHWFCEQTGCNGEGRTAALYETALGQEMAAGEGGYSFRSLRGISVNRKAELDTASLTESLQRVDPTIDSLLVSDLYSIELREKISADYVLSVEATYTAFVDYFDIAPLKDGHYFWQRRSVTRTVDEWLALSEQDFSADVEALAREVALHVRSDLDRPEASPAVPVAAAVR